MRNLLQVYVKAGLLMAAPALLLGLVILLLDPQPAAATKNPHTTITNFTLTVQTSATPIPKVGGCSVFVFNLDSTPIYVGGANVTTANGVPICSDSSVCVAVAWSPEVVQGLVHAVVASGTETLKGYGTGC